MRLIIHDNILANYGADYKRKHKKIKIFLYCARIT